MNLLDWLNGKRPEPPKGIEPPKRTRLQRTMDDIADMREMGEQRRAELAEKIKRDEEAEPRMRVHVMWDGPVDFLFECTRCHALLPHLGPENVILDEHYAETHPDPGREKRAGRS